MKKLLFAAVAVVFATSVSADLQQYTLKGLFTSSDVPSSIAVGDSYTLTFQLDTSTTDSNASLQDGIFMGAVTDLNFSLKSTAECEGQNSRVWLHINRTSLTHEGPINFFVRLRVLRLLRETYRILWNQLVGESGPAHDLT